ncbi:MAG: hypothetical protein P1S59_14480, partial [bacterium]|nr:hypothetical protein [bacterium]
MNRGRRALYRRVGEKAKNPIPVNAARAASRRDAKVNLTSGAVVESTFNWYWLVDLLMDAGYQVH